MASAPSPSRLDLAGGALINFVAGNPGRQRGSCGPAGGGEAEMMYDLGLRRFGLRDRGGLPGLGPGPEALDDILCLVLLNSP